MSKFDTWTPRAASTPLRYGLPFLSVAAAFSIRHLLRVYFEPTPNSLLFCAIVLSSWFGGLGPGLLTALLSLAVIHYRPLTHLELSAQDLPRAVVFLFSAAAISWLSGKQKGTEESLRQTRDELELKVQERTAELRRINEELRAE